MAIRKVTMTVDLEDHRPSDDLPKRYPAMTERLLEFFDRHSIRATFFVVGRLAEHEPELIGRIAKKGHEIALHSYDHTPITDQTIEEFREHTTKGKKSLEDITGSPIQGYRAPLFSLTKRSHWAVDVLGDLGFVYSSSTLPAPSPLYGYPDIPQMPFRWANNLLELPAPIDRIGPVTAPYLGGIYFRYLPDAMIQHRLRRADDQVCLWHYCHPYDIDNEEKNFRINGAPAWASLLLWFNRKQTMAKLERLVSWQDVEISKPFSDLIAEGTFDQAESYSAS